MTHLLVLVAFIFSCGGQWAALQCVAWVGMIHDYSQMVPLTEAVSMTFSGKYPCALCKAIAEKKQSESTKPLALETHEKKSLPPLPSVTSANPMVSSIDYLDYRDSLQSRTDTPPTPPPRLAMS